MKLTHFRVQNYKVIDDTEWVPVDTHVTALVGKNESGKTGILRSMWKAKNVANAKFDKLLDYPRERYAKERKGIQEVVSLQFELSDAETDELASQFPFTLKQKPHKVTHTTSYQGEDLTSIVVTFEEKVEKLCARPSADARKVVQLAADAVIKTTGKEQPAIVTAVDSALPKFDESLQLWHPQIVSTLEAFNSAITQWCNQDETHKSLATAELEQLIKTLEAAKQGDPSSKARQWVTANLPAFIYFDDYGQLETRIHLPTYLQRAAASPLDAKTRTQMALFEWSHLDPREILDLGSVRKNGEPDEQVQRRKDKRRALLDSASFSLSGDWMDWWPEKRHALRFDADGEDLVLKVADEHDPFPIPFEERSHGFQWFFSFYLVFLVESKKAHKGTILLLDEPGLHLHPTLQAKLIDLFDRISQTNQLVYSTHLPFLVDGNHLERVRTVHRDKGNPQRTVVSNDVRPSGDRDTLFPLQAAIGYSIAQTLFLGKRSVIVEGITDYWILKALNDCLAILGNHHVLTEDTVLIPAGGTSRLMPLASIMFSTTGVGERQLLVLLDSDTEGVQAAKRACELFGDDSRVLMLGDAIGLPKATVEDLVPRDSYVQAVGKTGKDAKLVPEECAEPMNVAALEKLFKRKGWGPFGTAEKAAAALKLVETWGQDPKNLPDDTRRLASALFAAINQRFH